MALSTRQLEQKMLTGTDCSPDQCLYNGGYWSMWQHKYGSIHLIMSLHDEASEDKIQVLETFYTNKADIMSNCETYQSDFLKHKYRDRALSYTGSSVKMIEDLDFNNLDQCLMMCQTYHELGSGYLFDPYSDAAEYKGSYRQIMLGITGY